jgi:hypothetical protein
MSESRKIVRSEAMKNKSKLQLKQANAQLQAQRMKYLSNRPKPRLESTKESDK